MLYFKLLATITVSLCLLACSGGSSNSTTSSPPVLNSIFGQVIHSSPSFLQKNASFSGDLHTMRFRVRVDISDDRGVGTLNRITLENSITNRFWDLLGGPNGLGLDFCFDSVSRIFDCTFFSSAQLDSLELTGWDIIIVDQQGNSIRRPFNFLLPDETEPFSGEFVYSDEFAGSFSGGTLGLEVLTPADNSLSFTIDAINEQFTLEFQVNDVRVDQYEFLFFDGADDPQMIGITSFSNAIIQANPIVVGNLITVNIPWSEVGPIESGQPVSPQDIRGVHVRLLEGEELIPLGAGNQSWFYHSSYSEYVSM